MKRMKFGASFVVGVLAVLMLVSAVSAAATYKDGTYLGFSDGDRRGYLMAMVTVKDDKITAVRLTEFTQHAVAKGADYAWAEFHEAIKVLPERFIAANSAEIDGVAKATGTSTKAIAAVGRALDKGLVNKAPGYQDGVFYGKSAADNNGSGVAWVTIKDGKIVKVEVDEILADGSYKDWATYPWKEAVDGKGIMEKAFVDAQGIAVDTVTGATHSGEKYIAAVKQALSYAQR